MLNIKKATGYAAKSGIKKGDRLVSMNGSPVLDFIDDGYFNSLDSVLIEFINARGQRQKTHIRKPADIPLGLEFEENLYPDESTCRNRCIFCFVDQLPAGMRESLYIKDDDWRYSVLFGNYVTLTNVDDAELGRIIARRATPLYISVHATDAECRIHMMKNRRAGKILEQLRELAGGGIVFHCQVVLCPGINDGDVLEKTITDLCSLYPQCRSLAVVPVGLTGHRQGLPEITPVSPEYASSMIDYIEEKANGFRKELGSDFLYAADEFYAKARREYPRYSDGGYYPQLSNGVGLFHEFLQSYEQALEALPEALQAPRKVIIATGVSAADQIRRMAGGICRRVKDLECTVIPVENRVFGKSITVSGLLSGQDIIDSVKGMKGDVLMLPPSAFRCGADEMLDGTTIKDIERILGYCVIIAPDDGYEFACTVAGIDF